MTVRLHNLAARSPAVTDVSAVVALLGECDAVEAGEGSTTEEDLRSTWQAAGFCLKTDAWVITTKQGRVVGYADVGHSDDGSLKSLVGVHPEYQGRGLGTLLTWLVEERARQLLVHMPTDRRVILIHTVSHLNQAARQLLENEGYTPVRHFWHLAVEMDELPDAISHEFSRCGKLKMAFVVDPHAMVGTTQLAMRTGMCFAHQYDVYEKELRAGQNQHQPEIQEACV